MKKLVTILAMVFVLALAGTALAADQEGSVNMDMEISAWAGILSADQVSIAYSYGGGAMPNWQATHATMTVGGNATFDVTVTFNSADWPFDGVLMGVLLAGAGTPWSAEGTDNLTAGQSTTLTWTVGGVNSNEADLHFGLVGTFDEYVAPGDYSGSVTVTIAPQAGG